MADHDELRRFRRAHARDRPAPEWLALLVSDPWPRRRTPMKHLETPAPPTPEPAPDDDNGDDTD
jgi:hypothetical protein